MWAILPHADFTNKFVHWYRIWYSFFSIVVEHFLLSSTILRLPGFKHTRLKFPVVLTTLINIEYRDNQFLWQFVHSKSTDSLKPIILYSEIHPYSIHHIIFSCTFTLLRRFDIYTLSYGGNGIIGIRLIVIHIKLLTA